METRVSENGKDVITLFRELAYDYFDRTGTLCIWKISYLCQVLRMVSIRSGLQHNFLYRSRDAREETSQGPDPSKKFSYSGRLVFVKTQEMTVYPALYGKVKRDTQLKGTCAIQYIGKSSYCFLQELQLASTGELVCVCSTLMVLIDKATRRPVHFEPKFVEQSLPFVKGGTVSFMRPIVDQPPSYSYRYSISVPASDMDSNYHVNQSNYIKYCMDCAAFGARDHAYSLFTQDIASYPIKSLSVLYIGESRSGQILDVISWEDREKPYIIYFIIRRGKDDIYQSIVRFNVDKSKL
ncbi:uncharacterized protein [Ptychodera flava]|uniref:uncharacterized protein n=1 Tax=Ptychodera flava TaxID=63121 RepID=UPI00396AA317